MVGRGGYVLIRGFVPGHTELTWLELFPGAGKAVARFPDIDTMSDLFGRAGFDLVHEGSIKEGTQTYAQRAEFSEQVRHADSILTAMSDGEVAAGIAALRSQPETVEHFSLSLLVYGQP